MCAQIAWCQLECGPYGFFCSRQVSFVFLDRPQQQPWPVVVRRKPRGLHGVKLGSAPGTSVSSSEFGQPHVKTRRIRKVARCGRENIRIYSNPIVGERGTDERRRWRSGGDPNALI